MFDQVLALVISKYFVPIYILVFCPPYLLSINHVGSVHVIGTIQKKKTTFNIHHIPIDKPILPRSGWWRNCAQCKQAAGNEEVAIG